MSKIRLLMRGLNSRRFRGLNSVGELVGKSVELTDDNGESTVDVVDSVKVESDSVELTTESGDQVSLTEGEADSLINEGQVESIEEPTETKEYEVTRELVNSEGEPVEVTTRVESESEDEAIDKVKLLDSKRGRKVNSKSYRVKNSEEEEVTPASTEELEEFDVTREIENPEGEPVEATTTVMAESDEDAVNMVKEMDSRRGRKVNAKSYRAKNSEDMPPVEMPEVKEFKVTRNCDGPKGKYRKVASVMAPSIEEAIEAVKAKDTEDKIKADGYEELVENLDKSTNVVINSDVEVEEEVEKQTIEEPESEGEGKDVEDPESERETNSMKGVSDYVFRAYGIKI